MQNIPIYIENIWIKDRWDKGSVLFSSKVCVPGHDIYIALCLHTWREIEYYTLSYLKKVKYVQNHYIAYERPLERRPSLLLSHSLMGRTGCWRRCFAGSRCRVESNCVTISELIKGLTFLLALMSESHGWSNYCDTR